MDVKELEEQIGDKDVKQLSLLINSMSDEVCMELIKKALKSVLLELATNQPKQDTKKEIVEEEKQEKNNERNQRTKKEAKNKNLTRTEVWELYKKNIDDLVLARNYLLKYIELCSKEKVFFDYGELMWINNKVSNLEISKEQILEEKELSKKIKFLLVNRYPNIIELEKYVRKFSKLQQYRTFYCKYYEGQLEEKRANPKKALVLYHEILTKEPYNMFVLRSIGSIYYRQNKYSLAVSYWERYLKYTSHCRIGLYIAMLKCYFASFRLSKIKSLTEMVVSVDMINKEDYFELAINGLTKNIEYYHYYFTTFGFKTEKEKQLERLLDYHNEEYQKLLLQKESVKKSLTNEYKLDAYRDELINCIYENNIINLGNIKTYVNHLNISDDEKMLMYLSATKILFQNRFINEADQYLKIVEKQKNKSKLVKEQYEYVKVNRKLYLNQ